MVDNEEAVQHLKEEVARLKSKLATSKTRLNKQDQFEQEHIDSQLKFKTVFEQSFLGHKFIDADLKIIKVNQALVELLGYAKTELIGSLITDIAAPGFAEKWKELQHELWTNKKSFFSIDTCITKKDQNVVWCHVTSILVQDNGQTLGYTILEDISKRKTLEIELKKANTRKRLFEQQLLELTIGTHEKERAHIAQDLHGSLGQLLYGVKLSLDLVELTDQVQNEQALKKTKSLLSACIRESRRISHELTPTILKDFGLKEAIQDICNQLTKSIDFSCEIAGLNKKLPNLLEIAVYRIIQELVTNLTKHAGATGASLKLWVSKNDILLKIEDNGKGFDTLSLEQNKGFGIRMIKARLQLLKGKLDISSSLGKGTIISIRIPR